MSDLKNKLPVAVHQVGGGEARTRTGKISIPLTGQTTGSFSTGTATKIRVYANLRTSIDILVLLSYGAPATVANAEHVLSDLDAYYESLGGPLTVHWHLIDMVMLNDRVGGQDDHLSVTFYE